MAHFLQLTICYRPCYTSGICLTGGYVGIDVLAEGSAI